MSSHPIVHIEFSSNNLQASEKFYNKLFDWKIQQVPEMHYATFEAEGGPGGGFNPVGENSPAGRVLVYIAVEDIEKTLAQVETLGGKKLLPKTEIPEMGWFAVFADPTGNQVGLFTEQGHHD